MTAWRRTPDQVLDGLQAWAHAWRGDGARVTDLELPDSGMANDTVMFRLDGEPVVARLAPAADSPYPTFMSFDLDLQERVIELVRRRTDVPVPEVVHHERTGGFLGTPFLVTRRVDGVVAGDSPPYLLDPTSWVQQGSPADRARMERSTIGVLARLHRVVDDGDETAFLHPATPGDTALARQLSFVRTYYDWAREGQEIPVLERAIERLEATVPATATSVLNWGDSRPGNILYRDFEPVAVLDWEMATVGPPEVDVAWATFFQRFWADMGAMAGVPVLEMFDPDVTAATYQELSGTALDDLAWYEALAGLRFGIILLRMSHRTIAFGMAEPPDHPDGHVMFAGLLDRLLARL